MTGLREDEREAIGGEWATDTETVKFLEGPWFERLREVIVRNALAARAAQTDARITRVEALTYAMDDGTEYEHNDGCAGEPDCPACWAASIRAALTAEPQTESI